MIHYLAGRATLFLHETNIIHEDLPIYQYGLELIISSAFGMFWVLLVSIVFHDVLSGFIFLCLFLLLRSYTGGYHSSTYLRCNLSMIAIYGCWVLFSFFMASIPWMSMTLIVSSVTGILVIFKYAPMAHTNKPLSAREKITYQRNSRIIALLYFLGAIGMHWMLIDYGMVVHYVLAITGFLLWIVGRKEEAYE